MLRAYPKPTKESRKERKRDEKLRLREYRGRQYDLVKARDGGMCVICFFKNGRKRPASEVHHVFSRGKHEGDWQEHYTNLMCVCPSCHPLPIQTPGASDNLGWVEDILAKANNNPINGDFEHHASEEEFEFIRNRVWTGVLPPRKLL